MPLMVNLGCGKDIRIGWENIDQFPGTGVNKVIDFSYDPLPYPDNSVDEILASHVLEHIINWEALVKEYYRVIIPKGKLTIKVPYMDYGPFHVRYFNKTSLNGFTYEPMGEHSGLEFDGKQMFKIVKFSFTKYKKYNYHFKKYFGINWGIPTQPEELTWQLEKMDVKQ